MKEKEIKKEKIIIQTFKLKESELEQLKKIAIKKGIMNKSEIIRIALNDYFEKNKSKSKK